MITLLEQKNKDIHGNTDQDADCILKEKLSPFFDSTPLKINIYIAINLFSEKIPRNSLNDLLLSR